MKKLMLFLMVAIPILVVMIVKLTATVAVGDMFISVESITLSETSISAMVGDSADLSFTIYPEVASNKEVIWSSSDENIATVDMNGHVEFVGIGSGSISATTLDKNKRSQCSFYVTDTKVHQVKLTAPQKYVHIGDTLQLSTTILPAEALNHEVSFSTSDEGIATVDTNGLVTGIAEGYVTITATTADGGLTDTLEISVITPVTSLIVEKEEVVTSSKTYQIEYSVEPASATKKNVVFEVDNLAVASVNETGLVTFKSAGQVNVTLSTVDGNLQRTVRIIYTAGYAYDLILEEPAMTIDVDSAPVRIGYQTLPENLYSTKVEFSSYDEDVAYVDSSGYLHALKGGNTVVSLKVQKSDKTFIEKQIYVTVISPAKEILIEDGITAEKTYQLRLKASPDDATDVEYFYHIVDSTNATVSESGLVVFDCASPCTVYVDVFANGDNSDVSKRVKITYTAGKASSFRLLDKDLTLSCGEEAELGCEILPTNATIRPLSLSIENFSPILEGSEVIKIENNKIFAISGGTARVKVSFVLYDATVVEDYCFVTVIRQPTNIEISIDLEQFNNQFVTSENTVQFSGRLLPLDALDSEISWSVDDENIAFIRDGALIFKQVGAVTLTARVGEISNSVDVYYSGANPVFAQVEARADGETFEIPKEMQIGESFEVVVSKIIPSYKVAPPYTIQITNQKTQNSKGVVLEEKDGIVTAVAGGTATLVVYISSSIRLSFEIEVERAPESLSVLQADTQVTAETVELVAEVLPVDATDKTVVFQLQETEIATLRDNILTFKANGKAYLTAYCQANENLRCNFYVEKVEKNMFKFDMSQTHATVNNGDLIEFGIKEEFSIFIEDQQPQIDGQSVVRVEGNYLRALSAGKANIQIVTKDKVYEIEITVNQLVEDIFFTGATDIYEGEYIVGKDFVELAFEVYPAFATNQKLSIKIADSLSGGQQAIAYISGTKLIFTRAGSVSVQVSSEDGSVTKTFKIKYTGGEAIDAQLNVGDTVVLDIGEQISIGVLKWLPVDVVNTRISLSEINSSGKKVIDINSRTNTITALESGQTKVLVTIANNITKEVTIICVRKVSQIVVEEEVFTASETYQINVGILPIDATNKTLDFKLEESDIAYIEGNVLHFVRAGKVEVVVRTTDGSNIQKTVSVTSTLGHISNIELEGNDIKIKKGESVKLLVKKFPLDALSKVEFKILGQEESVVSLTDEGQIVGLACGRVVVRAYAFDFYGREVFADCNILVYENITSFELQFDRELEQYQNKNTFITSKKELSFKVVCTPLDAEVQKFSYEILDGNFAKIEDEKIIFLQKGRVSITFNCLDMTGNKISRTYSFYYVENDLISATLDKSSFENGVLTLEAGEEYKFTLSKALPNDNENLNFTISDAVERRNDPNKRVASFENGTLSALNGGTYEFVLYVNGLKLEKVTVVVTRAATEIVVDGPEEAYVSSPYYTIKAHVKETDSQQSELGFRTDSNVASVGADGLLTFSAYGQCEVTVYVLENPAVSKIVKVTYTQTLQAIEFNKTRDTLGISDTIDLSVTGSPQNCGDFEYTMEVDKPELAELRKTSTGYRIKGLKSGIVVVTAQVVGKDISATKTIMIYDKISDIQLQENLNNAGGQGGYRVFGTTFFDDKNAEIHTYQMQIATITPSGTSKDILEWSSSDNLTATVDQNGLVTFLKAGRVTITVKQKEPYPGAYVVSDSYEFVLVDGINIYNFDQFKVAHAKLVEANKDKTSNYSSLVLHQDIHFEDGFGALTFGYNVCGNGYTLDHTKVKNIGVDHFIISKNGIELDNVVLRAEEIIDGSRVKESSRALTIINASNVLLYNVVVENAETGIRVICSQVKLEGCIIRNCLLVGMMPERSETVACDITIKDTIFAGSYIGIMYHFDSLSGSKDKINLEGEVRFYNWATIKQVEQSVNLQRFIDQYLGDYEFIAKLGASAVSEIYRQLEDIAERKAASHAYTYKGDKYYNFAILQMSASLPGKTIHGVGDCDRSKINSNCNYSDFKISDAFYLGVTVPVELEALSLSAQNPFIKPGDTYLDDVSIAGRIRQKCRF